MFRWAVRAAVTALVVSSASRPAADVIEPNDNQRAAGTRTADVLRVALEARTGLWYPEGERGRSLEVAAFAEEGGGLSTPGPLIRVAVGTTVRGTVRNRLDAPLVVFGLGATRGMTDSTVVPAHGASAFSFRATTPGTFYYVARRGTDPFGGRPPEDGQLHGVIVVDPPGAARRGGDQIMGISWACTVNPASRSGLGRCTMAINGLSWPHTQRLTYTQGDSVHWRVVNFTELDHPMHLHGFFFRMEARGDGVADTTYAATQQRMAVTEILPPYQTMAFSWWAERPGNWIYHCHYATHLSTLVALDTENGSLDSSMLAHHMSDRPHQMFGLVVGLTITPRGPSPRPTGRERAIRILQRAKPNVYGSQPGMAFVVDGTPDAANPDALPVPGPTLVLERGQPVAVTIVNQSADHAAVHWHGIELESYPDGVPGWSGMSPTILPAIAPHDSLTVRWTPPRAGSYMYHSHFSEAQQMGSGLYGPIIVVEPGERFDPETDRVLFFGTAGMQENPVFGPFVRFVMNGKEQPEPMELSAGKTYRLRLFNLAGDIPLLVSVMRNGAPAQWRAVAKDGYPLQPAQATMRPATLVFDPGEIYDFELTPGAGEMTLTFGPPPFPPPPPPPPGSPPLPAPADPPPTISVPIHVR